MIKKGIIYIAFIVIFISASGRVLLDTNLNLQLGVGFKFSKPLLPASYIRVRQNYNNFGSFTSKDGNTRGTYMQVPGNSTLNPYISVSVCHPKRKNWQFQLGIDYSTYKYTGLLNFLKLDTFNYDLGNYPGYPILRIFKFRYLELPLSIGYKFKLKNNIQIIPYLGITMKYAFYPEIEGSAPQRSNPWVLSDFTGYYNIIVKKDFGTNVFAGFSGMVPLFKQRVYMVIDYRIESINTLNYFAITSVEKYKNLSYEINFAPQSFTRAFRFGISYSIK